MLKSFSILLLLFLLWAAPAVADIELAPKGKPPLRLTDVYLYQGLPYVAVDDVLDAVSLRGHWDSVTHVYRIRTSHGWAELSPGRQALKIGDNYFPLADKPRFIDGRLRVSENFLVGQLAMLIDRPVYYRNLTPAPENREGGDSSLDRLFAFLLHKKHVVVGPQLRGITLDAGHGGLDTGVIAPDGFKEKEATLDLAERLGRLLKMNFGSAIFMSRDGDYELTPEQRLKAVAHDEVDVWLLLHAEGSFSPETKGVVLFVRGADDQAPGNANDGSRALADDLAAALEDAGVPVDGILSSPLVPLGKGNLPTVLLELGYLTNAEDRQRLESEGGQNLLAEALFQGLKNFSLNRKKN